MQLSLLLASAAKDPPLVDLDNTVFIQLGVFVVTALALSHFLFKPYLRLRVQREEGIEGARDTAKRMDEQARAQGADYETKLARAKLKAAEERTKLRTEAVTREREIVDKARSLTQATVEEARRTLEGDAKAARAALEPRTQEIARTVVKRILGREVA